MTVFFEGTHGTCETNMNCIVVLATILFVSLDFTTVHSVCECSSSCCQLPGSLSQQHLFRLEDYSRQIPSAKQLLT